MRKKKQAKAILNKLEEPPQLSTDKGRYLYERKSKLNKKARRHSGRYTAKRAGT